jgi:hypothetical protein
MACWRDHSAGASRKRAMPTPLGRRPSIAAFTSVGDRNASEMVMLTCRTAHFSRAAICSASVAAPVMSSSSQCRPRAIAVSMHRYSPSSSVSFSSEKITVTGCRLWFCRHRRGLARAWRVADSGRFVLRSAHSACAPSAAISSQAPQEQNSAPRLASLPAFEA